MADTQLSVVDDLVVSLDYTLHLDDGQVVETTTDHGTLEFLQGSGTLIPSLEEALYGMTVGDEKEVEITPTNGYGEEDPDAFEMVSRELFPPDVELTKGMGLHLRDEEGEVLAAYVADIRPEEILLDFNHPLAGQTLYFQVKISALRSATSEELAYGHVHSAEHEH